MTGARILRLGRRIGYALMAAALLLAIAARRGLLAGLDPRIMTAAALTMGAIGVLLVFTELMVRGLYAQIVAARDASPPPDAG